LLPLLRAITWQIVPGISKRRCHAIGETAYFSQKGGFDVNPWSFGAD
jgi:hypothetical protein